MPPVFPHASVSCWFSLSNLSPFLSIYLLWSSKVDQPAPFAQAWRVSWDMGLPVLKLGQSQANQDKLFTLSPDLHPSPFPGQMQKPPSWSPRCTPKCPRYTFHISTRVTFLKQNSDMSLCLKPVRHVPFSMAEGQENPSVL